VFCSLEVSLRIPAGERLAEPLTLVLPLAVIERPVIPAPHAAYALLRGQDADLTQVECARFAWSPAAARIELVSPEDLRGGIVRRRAVFHWRDTVRRGWPGRHLPQKLTESGSTHFPGVSEPD
jgi:hypothetical protein